MIVAGLIDAYALMLQQWPDLAGVQIHDGPAVTFMGNEGIAVGASREDASAEFTAPRGDLVTADGSQVTLTSLAWSSSGDTVFGPHRQRVEALFEMAADVLASDRTLRGAVSTAWIASGVFDQTQTGSGVLVTVEFRIEASRF